MRVNNATGRRAAVIGAAEKFKVPTIYPGRHHVASGDLISYGPDLVHPFRQAASYIDRILRGESPALLPVQLPVRQEMVLQSAQCLGTAWLYHGTAPFSGGASMLCRHGRFVAASGA